MHYLSSINVNEYIRRRCRLFNQLPNNSIVIIPTAKENIRSADTDYLFQPDRDFYYLTGFNEPEAVAVFIKNEKNQFILFNRAKNLQQEQWVGKFSGQQGAIENYHADESYAIAEFQQRLPRLLADKEHLYYPWGKHGDVDQLLAQQVSAIRDKERMGFKAPNAINNIEPIIHEMRLIKSAAEIEKLKYVCQASAEAHIAAMRACQPGMFEYQLQAEFSYVLQQQGCLEFAYPPIVAAGDNACILHYVDNSAKIESGDLVLNDVGGEYHYYAADITRTFPANGKFSEEQKQVYQVVLQAQLAGMETLRPGNSRQHFIDAVARVITEGLMSLGILQGKLENLLAEKAYSAYYPHSPGHWLGLDVHDLGAYLVNGQQRQFEPGMVVTNEPGIYIPSGQTGVDKKWWGIGVRIEDDVLITDDGPQVLTATVPRQVEEIEQLMAS